MFAFEVEQHGTAPIDLHALAGTLGNHGCQQRHPPFRAAGAACSRCTSTSADESRRTRADAATDSIVTDAEDVDHTRLSFPRPVVRRPQPVLARIRRGPGRLPERHYDKPRQLNRSMFDQPEHGTLAARITCRPGGATKTVRFVIAWNYPVGRHLLGAPGQAGRPDRPKTEADLDATTMPRQWARLAGAALADASDALGRARRRRPSPSATRLFGTTLPAEIIDAAQRDA